ncbi:class I SAM-dependent methyltransferase [Virgisporangium aurantiacum]|uniref:Methyltransferase n=1 Tax=Virgisporangium aurantiacum TaxID=175570 RepID=A0A8J3Z429_9ACTN|nr:class I SAM-dependent methyltransferase [Virgisporangium aurantiacum]GIJ54915.1 methyltransferase [Virgisporangium aurantiacum]
MPAADRTARNPGWSWDPSLYTGSAAFYATGRMAYPPELADAVVAELGLDGTGVLVDVGCGPGSLTLLLAPHVARAIGIDADPDMVAEAAKRAAAQSNVEWRCMRAEDLPADLGTVDVVTFAQSFHWMDRPRVAAHARRLLGRGGTLVHVSAMTHRGAGTDGPPWDAIDDLVERYLGPVRRAGAGTLPDGTPNDENVIYRAAGFDGPHDVELPGRVVRRSAAEVVASVYSLSSSAPHLFGDRLPAFDRDLRALLGTAEFIERTHPITLHFWRCGREAPAD